MSITLAKIKQIKAEAERQKTTIEETLRGLEKEAEGLRREIQTAAENGNEAAYFSKKEALSLTMERIILRRTQLEHLQAPFTPEEVEEAWLNYTEGYNKEFAALEKDIIKTRSLLHKQVTALVDKQSEALQVRKECADLMNIDKEAEIKARLKMSMIPNKAAAPISNNGALWNPEALYLYMTGEEESPCWHNPVLNNPRNSKYYRVIAAELPYKPES